MNARAPDSVRLMLLAFVALMGVAVPSVPAGFAGEWADLLLLVCAVCAAFQCSGLVLDAMRRRPAVWCALFFAAWSALATTQSGQWPLALGVCELCALFVLTITVVRDEASIRSALRVWCVAAAALGLAGFLGAGLEAMGLTTALRGQGGNLGPRIGAFRISGLCSAPNMLASLCIVPWLALVSSEGRGLFSRKARATLIAALSITLLFTMSRSWLAIGAGLCFGWGPERESRGSRLWRVAGLIVFAAAVLASARFQLSIPEQGLSPSFDVSVRWQILRQAFSTALQHPLFGVGLGSPAAFITGYPFKGLGLTGWNAHCTPIAITVAAGLPALAAFVAMIVLVIRRPAPLAELTPLARVLSACLFALCFDAMTLDTAHLRHFWLLLAFTATARGGLDQERGARDS